MMRRSLATLNVESADEAWMKNQLPLDVTKLVSQNRSCVSILCLTFGASGHLPFSMTRSI